MSDLIRIWVFIICGRYLNPYSGRFLSADSYEGTNGDPLSLHKYLLALELAGDFALRKDPPHVVMIGKLPQSVFERLRPTGAVYSTTLAGAPLDQTIFLPQSFRAINYYNRGKWLITPG